MALQHLDKSKIQSYLNTVWHKKLDTTADPANGQWHTNSPTDNQTGLYGGLTDSMDTELVFDDSKMTGEVYPVVLQKVIINNLTGTTPKTQQVSFSYSETSATETTHSVTNSITAGAELNITESATIAGAGTTVGVTFSFEYTHSWQDTMTEREQQTATTTVTEPFTVPPGEIAEIRLTAVAKKLEIPYKASVVVTGITETWFEDRIAGHYNHKMSAGEAFGIIHDQNIAGDNSQYYVNRGNGTGAIVQQGKVKVNQSVDISMEQHDVTPSATGGEPQGTLVRKVPVAAQSAAA